ncbi:hypothetical protein CR513_58454, partial [Mucuna pruriens]
MNLTRMHQPDLKITQVLEKIWITQEDQKANPTTLDQVTNFDCSILHDNLLASPIEIEIPKLDNDLYLPIVFRK